MFQGIFKSAINDANKNYIFGTGSIPINIKTAQLATFADGTTKQQGYQVAEVNKLISTMLTGWDKNGNKPKSMSDNYLELILSCDNGFVVKKRLQFPHIIAWKDDSTPYNIADVYKEFSIDNWLKADDFENPDITLVVEPTDEILTTSTATPPEATTEQSGRFYLYYRNLPVGINRVHIEFHIKTKTEPIDFDLEVMDGLSWKDAQVILASNEQAKVNVLLGTVKDVYKFTGAEGNFEDITMHEWSELYQQIITLNPSNKFTHDLYFYIYDESELNTKITELGHKVYDFGKIEETLQLQLVLGAYMKYSDLSTLENSSAEYWQGTLSAGTYKISGFSVNASYPCLAKKVNGSYTRAIYPGDSQIVTDYEITFDSDTEVIINGRQDVGLIVVKTNLPVTFQDIYDKVSSLSDIVEDTTPMRIKTRKYTDAQGRDCLIYDIFKRFNNSYDVRYSFGNKYNTPNANFDFYGIALYNRADQLGDGTLVSEHFAAQTDSILPIIVTATNNADGDFPTSTDLYTGGYHGYNNASTSTTKPTSRTISQKVYADGFEVVDGTDRFCQKVKMVIVTNVQGCNTEKSDGSGREIMEQTIVVGIDSLNTKVNVQWKALEDVTIYSLHGFAISAPSCNGRFIGSKTDRGLYPIGTVKRTTSIPDAIRAILSNGHYLDIRLNRVLDLGRYGYNDAVDSYKATITTANKIYTLMLSEQMPMSQNDVAQYEADYQFV